MSTKVAYLYMVVDRDTGSMVGGLRDSRRAARELRSVCKESGLNVEIQRLIRDVVVS